VGRKVDVQSLERKALLISLPVVVGGSILANLLAWDVKWQIPLIFAALYIVLSLLMEIRDNQKPSSFTHYNNSDEFFTSFSRLVQSAERRIYTSYVRRTPPPSFRSPAAKQYFRDVVQWMRRNPGATFHRIFGVPSAEPYRGEMLRWLAQHQQEMRGVTNYHARVVPLAGDVDAINIAIIDEKAVLILLTSDGSFMSGHRLDAPSSVSSFRDYYSAWWTSAEPLDAFLTRVRPQTSTAVDRSSPPSGSAPPD